MSKQSVPGKVPPGDHEEWLLDESLVETFPASDPIAPAVPPEPKADSPRSKEPGSKREVSTSRLRP